MMFSRHQAELILRSVLPSPNPRPLFLERWEFWVSFAAAGSDPVRFQDKGIFQRGGRKPASFLVRSADTPVRHAKEPRTLDAKTSQQFLPWSFRSLPKERGHSCPHRQ